MKILLIDDDPKLIKVMNVILTEKGHTVTAVLDGFKGFNQAKSQKFDLILLDISMPGQDGLKTCALIRDLQQHKNTPVFIMTALRKLYDIEEAFRAGATDYVYKNSNLVSITERIERKLLKKQAQGGVA